MEPDVSAPTPAAAMPDPAPRFDSFALPDELMTGIRAAGFTTCTPIQALTLPLTLAGKDVAGQAQTGTGKTAAFLISVFKRLLEHPRGTSATAPRALVIAPTRELVVQIASDARLLGSGTPFKIHAVFGGVDYRAQREQLAAGVDVLIGTPGRLIDYLKQHVYDLSHIEVLVIDEADRMFDMGFIKDLRFLLRRLPPYDRRQSLLFSATLSFDVMELAYVFMNEAVKVSATPEVVTAERIEHAVYYVSKEEKIPLLVHLLGQWPGARTLLFVNTRVAADKVVRTLELNGYAAGAITGDVDQRKRLRILQDFKDGTLPILVATDVASRGLHIDGVTHVLNFDIPFDAEDYVHRAGRTARAGASGKAVSFACEQYAEGLEGIEKYVGFKLPAEVPSEEMLAPVRYPPRSHTDRRPPRGRSDRDRPRSSGPRPKPAPPPTTHAAGPAPANSAEGAPKKRRRRRRPRGQNGAAGSGGQSAPPAT